MSEWNGEERRKMNQLDHDLLIEIHSDIKHIASDLKDHVLLDDSRQLEIKSKLEFHQKVLYGIIGIVGFIELASKFIK